ncbi:uncharacterized protein LOC116344680 [Contarinia nasturtii]|uniref:uncharacterized protein LOC116344680 n=1 Tax=Contarinia nasturtii TaxID=265458 RepID=UPI0012D4322C|nr:uncharacterized protein LOC116344680 [Contarinia nasturtii]
MSFELKVKGIFGNKVILITGASSGIGTDGAVHLAKKGAMVSRNQENLNSVSDKIKSFGAPNPLIIVADVTTDGERIIEETVTHFGRLDVLINNAGIVACNSIQTIKLHEFDRIMNVNVRAIQLSQLAVLHLAKSNGNILNVSSVCSTV